MLLDPLERVPLRERLMLVVAQRTGLRDGEVARVLSGDGLLGLGGHSLHVRGKGARERLVPLDEELARILRLLPAGGVFRSSTRPGEHLTAHTVSRVMSAALGPGWTAHTLRHRYASLAYSVERDLRAVQELLGHAQVTTTQVDTPVPNEPDVARPPAPARSPAWAVLAGRGRRWSRCSRRAPAG